MPRVMKLHFIIFKFLCVAKKNTVGWFCPQTQAALQENRPGTKFTSQRRQYIGSTSSEFN